MMVQQTWLEYIPHIICMNLITQHACSGSSGVCDSLQWASDFGVLFGQSMKTKSIFQNIIKAESSLIQWTVQPGAIHLLPNQNQSVFCALEEMASGKSDSASRVNGLLA